MTSAKPGCFDPDVTLCEDASQVETERLRGDGRLPPPGHSTTGRLRLLRNLINHHETGQSGNTPESFLENDDRFDIELVEIKPSQRG